MCTGPASSAWKIVVPHSTSSSAGRPSIHEGPLEHLIVPSSFEGLRLQRLYSQSYKSPNRCRQIRSANLFAHPTLRKFTLMK